MKTNGARFLESLNIPFELREYEVDPEDLSAITVAKKIGMPAEQVFKTLLTTDSAHEYVFAVIPGDSALDFKKLSRLAGWRKAEMAPLKDVQPLTGYIRGGVTIFGAKKPYPVFVDETAILFDRISVSAGTRGTQLILTPDDYLRAAAAIGQPVQTADLTKDVAAPSSNVGAPFQGKNVECPIHAPVFRRMGGRPRANARRSPPRGPPPLGGPILTRALFTHLAKDLRIEWRTLDAMISMIFFSGLVVVLFSIAFDPRGYFSQQIAGGVLCVATMFASVSALNQAWAREIRHQVMDAQRMVPSPGAELYLAKTIANFLFVSIVQIVLAPFFFIFYNLHIAGNAWQLALVLPLGTWALVVNGVFFAALSIGSRNREFLLSLILFPIFIPALLAMVQAVTSILTGDADPALWIKMLLGYDIIFTTASLLLFDVVFHAE